MADSFKRMYCKHYHCEMSESACKKRQEIAGENVKSGWHNRRPGLSDSHCADCAQGRAVADGQGNQEKKWEESQTNRSSEKEAVMDTVAEKVCKNCGVQKALDKFDRNKMCKDGHVGRCKACRRDHARSKKKALSVVPVAPTPTPEKPASSDTTVVIDFSDYPEMLEVVKARAFMEFRTVENQILFALSRETPAEKVAGI